MNQPNIIKKSIVLLATWLLIFSTSTNGQFTINGDASQLDQDCWQLTPGEMSAKGSIWHEEQINLLNSFDLLVNMNFGCDNGGADGIVFVFQNISSEVLGNHASFLGYGPNFPTSLAVEFDTFKNNDLDDLGSDHIAIHKNGNVDHNSNLNLAGPVKAMPNQNNIEDCEYYPVRIIWDADNLTLEVYFDCMLRLSYTGDIVNEIFGGNPMVYWGFTAGTGGAFNEHIICFDAFPGGAVSETFTICEGENLPLSSSQLQANSYSWTPTTGLSSSTIANPIATPTQTTTYIVTALTECDFPVSDTFNIIVNPISNASNPNIVFEICAGDDTQLMAREGTNYLWQPATFLDDPTIANPIATPAEDITYLVTGLDECGNTFTDTVNFIVLPIDLDFTILPAFSDTVFCLGEILDLTIQTNPEYVIEWQDGSSESFFTITESGTYEVTISNECSSSTASMEVVSTNCAIVTMPNIFTPDFDGVNDFLAPISEFPIDIIQFKIFNRWGAVVYDEKNSQGWDGTFKGKAAAMDVYVYLLEYSVSNGESEILSGDVTLLR